MSGSEQTVATNVGHLLERIGRMTRALQYAAGLNPAQWESLRFLGMANRRSRTPTALACFLGSTKGTASQTVLALEEKGLVGRAADTEDRRAVVLEVTEAGRGLLAEDPLCGLSAAVTELPAGRQMALAEGLELLLRELARRNGWREFGVCQRCGHFVGAQEDGQCALLGQPIPAGESVRLCTDYQPCPSAGQVRDVEPAARG